MKIILGTMTFADQVEKPEVRQMLNMFSDAGGVELDTAYQYQKGKTEILLGNVFTEDNETRFQLATKVNPWDGDGLRPAEIRKQFDTSLERLQTNKVDMLYLHAPDVETPVEESLQAIQSYFEKSQVKRFGVSNYAAWQVAEIVEICRRKGWVQPSVYQGLYNALNRDVETELLECLKHYGLAFYAYNPLAGGLLTGKHKSFESAPDAGRFDNNEAYQARYWKADYFAALDDFVSQCHAHDIAPTDAALRWMSHHSDLSAARGDGVIIGASQVTHLQSNLDVFQQAPLPESILESLDRGWLTVKPNCFRYFRR